MMPFLHMFQYEWENDFTVVQWDQRNVGKTYLANDPKAVLQTMSAEHVLEDVHEVTKYIKQHLNKDKIIIMGRCWEQWPCRLSQKITAHRDFASR